MTALQTEAGRALLATFDEDRWDFDAIGEDIAAIETEAARATVERIRAEAEEISWTGHDMLAGMHAWHVAFLAFLDKEVGPRPADLGVSSRHL